MKKVILIAIFSLTIYLIFGQSYPGNNPELLINKNVRPIVISEILQEHHYKNFYLKYNDKKKTFSNKLKNKPFSSGQSYSPKSDYKKLVGKEFTVLEVSEMIPDKEFAIKLENPEVGVIYYKYDSTYEHEFELEVIGGELDFPDDFFCSQIMSEKDKFSGEESYSTPMTSGIHFVKTVKDGVSRTYLSVFTFGDIVTHGEKGLFLLFDDGDIFTKSDANIDVDVNKSMGSRFRYSAFIEVSTDDLKIFSEKIITDKRLYIYDGAVENEAALKIRQYAKCLIK